MRKVESYIQCHAGLLPKVRDGTSPMAFCFPSMCSVINGHVLFVLSCRASACTECSATRDFWEARCKTQATVGMLLLKSTTHFSAKTQHTPSITSHSSNMPAISRSELVMLPVGFPNDLISFRISSGHSHRNTVGMHSESSPRTTTLPTP